MIVRVLLNISGLLFFAVLAVAFLAALLLAAVVAAYVITWMVWIASPILDALPLP